MKGRNIFWVKPLQSVAQKNKNATQDGIFYSYVDMAACIALISVRT